MRKTILLGIAGGLILVPAVAANAQSAPAPTMPAGSGGGVRSQDVAAANRELDSSYNTLSARGVKTTDKDRENARSKRPVAVPATAADIKSGAQIRDVKGVPIGTVATLGSNEIVADAEQIVVDTGHGKIGVPLSAFGKDDKGLLLSITAQTFNQLVAQANAGNKTQSN